MTESPSPAVFATWPTVWGPMAAVAGPAGIRRVYLPHYHADDLADLVAFENPGAIEDPAAPPGGHKGLAELAELAQAYFRGQRVSFDTLACELPAPRAWAARVLAACRKIPYGQTQCYRWVATAGGNPDGARAAAAALGKNPIPLVVPCHRVTYADGRPGGFSAAGGVELKMRMLALESRR